VGFRSIAGKITLLTCADAKVRVQVQEPHYLNQTDING